VFDKIKENERLVGTVPGMTYTEMANQSLNQVLMRSLNTSFVALLPVASLLVVGVWIYGALALRDFGLALFVGLLTGAYSSIYVATPILAWLKEREPKYKAVAERAESRAQRAGGAAPVPTIPATIDDEDEQEPIPAGAAASGKPTTAAKSAAATKPTSSPAPAAPSGQAAGITPRPRQQRGRKRK
jgi:preprotein translocase subunit SecF